MKPDRIDAAMRRARRHATRRVWTTREPIIESWGPDDCGGSCGVCDVCKFDNAEST